MLLLVVVVVVVVVVLVVEKGGGGSGERERRSRVPAAKPWAAKDVRRENSEGGVVATN